MKNIKIVPIQTEKSLSRAKDGVYTFRVNPKINKSQIKSLIKEAFGVDCLTVKTENFKKMTTRNYKGTRKTVKAYKKIMVSLKEGQKIDMFEKKGK